MKFFYSDTQDYVDPDYDFLNDLHGPNREKYWSEQYAHEMLSDLPYDGLLVAMSGVVAARGMATNRVRYTKSEAQRLLNQGVRSFFRLEGPRYKGFSVMGDCGAFAYADQDQPPYEPQEVIDFYMDSCFDSGVSPDHVIFDCDMTNPARSDVNKKIRERYDVTLSQAEEFLKLAKAEDDTFTPIGAVQGWSPESMANAAKALESMGYSYLAVGGLVPLGDAQIKTVLSFIRSKISPKTRIHLLGFAKAETIQEFTNFGITSFDSTSPLIRAFKDQRSNYYSPSPGDTGLNYYAAIRIPQALDNMRLQQGIKEGKLNPSTLVEAEKKALSLIRDFDKGEAGIKETLNAVIDYQRFLLEVDAKDTTSVDKKLSELAKRVERTLEDQPWKKCSCDICSKVGVEVIIFRSNNRNRRRGFHNLHVYRNHLKKTIGV
jgi:hypothetical protein